MAFKKRVHPGVHKPVGLPIVTVRKPNGKVHLCMDFKKINAQTTPLPFYMPLIEEVVEAEGSAHYISTLDLSKGYYQILMSENDIPKMAFICHVGKYEFVRMPFGVRNTPALFQTLIDKLLRDKRPFARSYMDDIIIFSNCWDDHLTHIRQILIALRDAGLTANPSKCKWGGEQIEFWDWW